MFHSMARESRVVGFQIEFDVVFKSVGTDETDAGSCIEIVLVFGGLLGFGFKKELVLELLELAKKSQGHY